MSRFVGKKAAILTLGCRVNQYDEMVIVKSLSNAGFTIVDFDQVSDLYVINTCTVTHKADADSRKAARRAMRTNPRAFIAVVGCYAQHASREIGMIDGIDLILGNKNKFDLVSLLPDGLAKLDKTESVISDSTFEDSFGDETVKPLSRSRVVLKIQDGCDQLCKYCIVPHVRGKPRSLESKIILARTGELAASGFKEIVLTGVHIGLWGREYDKDLSCLVDEIDSLDGEFRFRISSIEPMEITPGFIDAIAKSSRICRHLHIPIQSASDSVLRDMGRPYRVSDIVSILDMIKSKDEGWNIGVDLMTGYPTETGEYFNEQLENLEKLPIDYFHLFTYSQRPGTPAAIIPSRSSREEINKRLDILKVINKESQLKFKNSQNMRILIFITEKTKSHSEDIIMGVSDNYVKARMNYETGCTGLLAARLRVDKMGRCFADSL
jgi:threonylcarbamoyladenosine tRNA methylthiotransferase MtaB